MSLRLGRNDNVVRRRWPVRAGGLIGAVGAALALHGAPAANAASGAPVTVSRDGHQVVLANGYVRATFDLDHPQISSLEADFHGRGDYGADLTQGGADPLHRSGIVLERTDAAAPRVLDAVGITDADHRSAGGFAGPTPYSLAAELLPPGGGPVTPAADASDDVPVWMPDTSGAAPNLAGAHGQTFEVPADDRGAMRAVHVFGTSTDGDGTGTFELHFADGTTERHSVTLPDWGANPAPRPELHSAFTMPYRHSGTGNDAPVPFHVYHAVVPVDSRAPLTGVTFPDGVPNRSTSVYPTGMYVLGLTLESDDGSYRTPALGWNDPRPGSTDHASSAAAGPDLQATVRLASDNKAEVRIDGVLDDASDPLATSSWTLTLERGSRTLGLEVDARALRDGGVAGLRVSHQFSPYSTYGLFEHRGVTQRMNAPDGYFASADALHRFYSLGGGGSVDVTADGQQETVLRNAAPGSASPSHPASGVEQVLAGSYPTRDAWDGKGWTAATPTELHAGDRWHVRSEITPNDYDFPAATVPADVDLPFADLRALLTGVYGTAVGALDTYALPGEASPTLATPGRGYDPGRNFYDPDTFMLDSALLYSGDPYLERQARETIEKSGAAIRPDGQVPHHFDGTNPTYVALSGATQTGPNIFWISAALRYAETTGDVAWLRDQKPVIERAMNFLTDRYDPSVQLISAPGPLWIDVFIRENYTSDTNAYMVGLLRQVADVEEHLGDAALAARRRAMAADIVEGMNAHLWDGDHYVTQLNPDGTTRDLVDYDSNLLAVAFGAAPPERAAQALARVDAGPCTHGRATWVSERYYGPADTYGGNTGDSATAMARIGWADGLARRAVGDRATFSDQILGPLQSDLLERTFLTERYDCAGNPIRTPYYHEYPEVVGMLLREVAYGIDVGLGTVDIDPFTRDGFRYHLGSVDVAYSRDRVLMTVPGTGATRYAIHGLAGDAAYRVFVRRGGTPQSPPQHVRTDATGVARFTAPAGPEVSVEVKRLED